MARARRQRARVLDDKLANWSGGRRYRVPLVQVRRTSTGVRIAIVPGFQPFAAYDVVPRETSYPARTRRRADDERRRGAGWTDGSPLATREVAVVCEITRGGALTGSAAWPSSSTSASTASGCRLGPQGAGASVPAARPASPLTRRRAARSAELGAARRHGDDVDAVGPAREMSRGGVADDERLRSRGHGASPSPRSPGAVPA